MKFWVLPMTLVILTAPATSIAQNKIYDPVKRAEKMLKQMDADRNGSVSIKEFLRPANFRFNRFDTNKNGSLARQELYDFWKNKREVHTDNINAWEGPTRSHFKRFDKNKDDVITREEYLSKSKNRFKTIDSDKNNVISQQELNDHWIERSKEAAGYDFSEKDDD